MLDVEGEPLAGVEVELWPEVSPLDRARSDLDGIVHPAPVDRAVTGDDGSFRLAVPEEGLWTVAARAAGRVPVRVSVGPLLLGEELPPLAPPPDVGLSVRVVDAAGEPVPRATVAVGRYVFRNRGRSWRLSSASEVGRRLAVTGDDGRAALPRREGEVLTVVAAAAGFAVAEEGEVEGGEVTLTLRPGREVPVEVRGPDGRPRAGAVLVADGVALGLTDEAGRHVVHAPADRPLTVVALAQGELRGRLVLTPPEGGEDEEDAAADGRPPEVLRLAAPVTISGRTLDPDRHALAGAWVWEPARPDLAARSDGRGGFHLTRPTPAPEGESTVVGAVATGRLPVFEQVRPAQLAGDEPVTLLLAAAAAATGRVVDAAGEPVAGAMVSATPLDAGMRSAALAAGRAVRCDERGNFRLEGLSPDAHYLLAVREAGYAPASVQVAGLQPGVPRSGIEIVLRPGVTARGTVLDLDGEPVPGAEVALTPLPQGGGDPMAMLRRRWEEAPGSDATSDRDGVFEIPDLEPGRYDLAASAAGFAPLVVPGVELPRGAEEVDLGSVILEPGAVLEGTVVDAERRPVEGAEVRVMSDRGLAAFFGRRGTGGKDAVTTGPDGVFQVDDLAREQRVQVSVRHRGHADRLVTGVRVPAEEPLVITLEPTARLSGVVLDGAGGPIENARISTRSLTGPGGGFGGFSHGSTDASGTFTLEDVTPGEVTVTVYARGFVAAERTGLQVAAGEEREDLRFTLEPGASVEGRVVDEAGRPLAEARLVVVGGDGQQFARSGGMTNTDGDGAYLLEGIPLGARSIAAEHPDHLRQVRDLEVSRGVNRLDFRLPAGAHVAGRVLDAGGAPVPGARVMLGDPSRPSFSTSQAAISGEDGAYRVAGVAPGRYQVRAVKEGYAAAMLAEPIEVTGPPLEGVDLRLTTGARIVGRLLGVELQDLAAATVGAGSQGPSGYRLPVMGSVDYEGNFRIEGVSPGDWMVFAAVGGGLNTTREPVTVEPGDEEVYLELDLGSGFTLSGTVTLGAEPMAGAAVAVAGTGQLRGGFASTDHQGRFEVGGLEAGEYEVTVMSLRGGAPVFEETIHIAGDRELTIDVPTAEVAGVITDAATGAALEGAEVRLEATEGQGRAGGGFWARRSDADGRYRLPAVPAGDYRLVADLAGYAPGEAVVRVEGAAAVTGVDLRLQPTRGLDLVVHSTLGPAPQWVLVAALDPAVAAATPGTPGSELGGAPAAGGDGGGTAPASAAAAPRAVFNARLQTGEGGRLRLDRLPAGRWRLVVGAPGLANADVEVTAPGPAVPVTLGPEAVLQVRVPELEAGRGEVRLTAADGRPHLDLRWNGDPVATWDLVFGRTQVDGLQGGTWTVTVTTDDGATWSGRVAVPPGGTVEAVLDGPPR